jgi:hypothetical protein
MAYYFGAHEAKNPCPAEKKSPLPDGSGQAKRGFLLAWFTF